MRTFVVAAMHGDEPFGLKIVNGLDLSENLTAKIGHPEALKRGVRYIDQDLNRSFAVKDQSIESSIAQTLKEEINAYAPDAILDIHTSITDAGKVAIVAEYCPLTDRLAYQLGLDAIVVMPKKIASKSLIGCFPRKSISLEFGSTQRSDELAKDIAQGIQRLTMGGGKTDSLPVFQVFGEIDKNFKGLAGIKNLVFNEELQGYPFLAGADSYKEFGGFIAKKVGAPLGLKTP